MVPGLWSDWNGGNIGCIAGVVWGRRDGAGRFPERSKNLCPIRSVSNHLSAHRVCTMYVDDGAQYLSGFGLVIWGTISRPQHLLGRL